MSTTHSAGPTAERDDTTVWYFKVEGRGEDSYGITGRFGFFVHCVVATPRKAMGMQAVTEALQEDEFTVIDVPFTGKFSDLNWNDSHLGKELRGLARDAASHPGIVFFSTFHFWKE